MHFTGQIWRPPFEADSALLQVTSGCMHNKCKFCSLYKGTHFRVSPFSEIEMDLAELKFLEIKPDRFFLTAANPFGLKFNKLKIIGEKMKTFFPQVKSIGGFARISDIKTKSQKELIELRKIGFDKISIGTETGDDETLAYMNKAYTAKDIIEELHKLDESNITYNITYMNGLAGKKNSERHARERAKVFNETNPESINVVGLTIFPDTELYQEVQSGKYTPANETEMLYELKTFIQNLTLSTKIHANTVSNTAPFTAELPQDKDDVQEALQEIIDEFDETILSNYRKSILSL
jgi:radical SAM superfamily enzyme YgiQ (UPF0313 family)